ncbi:MAG: hypothetical protein ACD_43C00254G0001 [uncultured bacterium]|nr:MAG: hypothetical protein ACD_43C00254G0001 [uncultured bacterium]
MYAETREHVPSVKTVRNVFGTDHRTDFFQISREIRKQSGSQIDLPKTISDAAVLGGTFLTRGGIPINYDLYVMEGILILHETDDTIGPAVMAFSKLEPDWEYISGLGIKKPRAEDRSTDALTENIFVNLLRPEKDIPERIRTILEKVLQTQTATYEQRCREFYAHELPAIKERVKHRCIVAIAKDELSVPINQVEFLLDNIAVNLFNTLYLGMAAGGCARGGWNLETTSINLTSSDEDLETTFEHEFIHALSRQVAQIITAPDGKKTVQPRRIGLEFEVNNENDTGIHNKYRWLNEAVVELVRCTYLHPEAHSDIYEDEQMLVNKLIEKTPALSLPFLRAALFDGSEDGDGHIWHALEMAIVSTFGRNILDEIDTLYATENVSAALAFVEAL